MGGTPEPDKVFHFMTYSEKLKDPRWQKKRLEILELDNWTCQNCGDTQKTLHVHHKQYIKGREPWDYDNSNFITLCEKCHKKEEKLTSNSEMNDNVREFGILRVKQNSFLYHLSYAFKYKPEVYEKIRNIVNKEILKPVQKRIKNG